MPLFIRDDEVTAMAEKLAKLTKASKTDAVRAALRHELERTQASVPLRDRLARIHEKAAKIGLPNASFDMKAYTDEMWGDA